jgi:RHS repeat-associated protein
MLQGPKDQPRVAAALFGGQCVLPLAAGSTSKTTYSCDARTLPETRVWGSEPENVHCSSATARLKIEQRWGCEESSEKTAVGSRVSFKYDPFGRRIEKTTSSTTSIYAYDGDNLVEETNAAGGVVARYAQTQNIDEPLAMLRSATTSYYHADGLGSITSLSNSAGALAQTYTFDSFGKQTASTGSLTNPFRFTGRELDSETNLYYFRARYSDSNIGRFISEDPIRFAGGINFYAYVANFPVQFTDPFGLIPRQAPQGLLGQLQNIFPGSTLSPGANPTLNIPMSCKDASRVLAAQGYTNGESNFFGYNGPGSAYWNPFNHAGGWEWRTGGPGFHFRMPYDRPDPFPDSSKKCGDDENCKLDQFHIDSTNPVDQSRPKHIVCDFLHLC